MSGGRTGQKKIRCGNRQTELESSMASVIVLNPTVDITHHLSLLKLFHATVSKMPQVTNDNAAVYSTNTHYIQPYMCSPLSGLL